MDYDKINLFGIELGRSNDATSEFDFAQFSGDIELNDLGKRFLKYQFDPQEHIAFSFMFDTGEVNLWREFEENEWEVIETFRPDFSVLNGV